LSGGLVFVYKRQFGEGGRERAARRPAHRRKHDRVPHAEKFGECRRQGHGHILAVIASSASTLIESLGGSAVHRWRRLGDLNPGGWRFREIDRQAAAPGARLLAVSEADEKQTLHRYLQNARGVLLWKLEGLSDYDIRRPMTPTGTNLLGLVKHCAGGNGDTSARWLVGRSPAEGTWTGTKATMPS
jgi:hypothetical protein